MFYKTDKITVLMLIAIFVRQNPKYLSANNIYLGLLKAAGCTNYYPKYTPSNRQYYLSPFRNPVIFSNRSTTVKVGASD